MSLALTLLMVIVLYSTVEAAATGSQLESQDGSQKAADNVDDEDAAQFLHSVYKTPYLEAVVEQPAESYISWNSVNE